MTKQQHPISPPSDLVEKWIPPHLCSSHLLKQWKVSHHTFTTLLQGIADNAAQWGYDQREPEIQAAADQELEACCNWLDGFNPHTDAVIADLRAARRPKPPSLKEQAREALETLNQTWTTPKELDAVIIIRRALEALPE
jgi:hypothetical protein